MSRVFDPLQDAEPEAEATARPALEVIRAQDYIDHDPPEHDAILDGLFDMGDKAWLIGGSKARKSFFVQQLSFSLATGRPFLGWKPTKARRVLLVQMEVKPEHFHRRCFFMAKALGTKHADNLLIVNGRGLACTPYMIRDVALEHDAEVIVIDPLYKVLRGEENNAADMGSMMRDLDAVATTTGAAVVIVHHEKKGLAGDRQAIDRGAGSGTLARDFDAAIYLAEHATEPDAVVVSSIARNYPPSDPFTAQWQDGRFVEIDAPPLEATSASRRKANGRRIVDDEQVLRIVASDGPFATEAMTRRLMDAGLGRDMAKETPRRLISDGVLHSWKERRFHGVTWVGTKAQIDAKRAQTDQSDRATQADGVRSVCESEAKHQ